MSGIFNAVRTVVGRFTGVHLIFGALTVLTALGVTLAAVNDGVGSPSSGQNPPSVVTTTTPSGTLSIVSRLVQSTFLQGSPAEATVRVEILTPQRSGVRTEVGTDFAIAIDTSGSMADERKLSYAKSALEQFISALRPNDRFALIRFSTEASVVLPLSEVNAESRSRARAVIQGFVASGSTNIGAGIQLAMGELGRGDSALKKVVLLSDGQANVGIVDTTGLVGLVQVGTKQGYIVSTIGMGVDFNQQLLSTLSDYGMGEYAFLESPAGMEQVLARYISSLREVYAQRSELQLTLPEGVSISDSSGYPVQLAADGRGFTIPVGALAGGASRILNLTFRVPTESLRRLPLASMRLVAFMNGVSEQLVVAPESLEVAIVERSRVDLVASSVNRPLYEENWAKNNLGKLKQEMQADIAEGRVAEADRRLSEFSAKVAKDDSLFGAAAGARVESELKELRGQNESIARAPEAERERRQKAYSKGLHASGLRDQRAYK